MHRKKQRTAKGQIKLMVMLEREETGNRKQSIIFLLVFSIGAIKTIIYDIYIISIVIRSG